MKKHMLLLSFALIIVGCSSAPQKAPEIPIGAIFPLTGNAATFGQSSKQAMQLAVDAVNAKGGILVKGSKRTVKAIYEDSEGSPEKAANACQKLLSQDRIVALVG
jgi:branched-chain amino acid transport system substrate-binding protein